MGRTKPLSTSKLPGAVTTTREWLSLTSLSLLQTEAYAACEEEDRLTEKGERSVFCELGPNLDLMSRARI